MTWVVARLTFFLNPIPLIVRSALAVPTFSGTKTYLPTTYWRMLLGAVILSSKVLVYIFSFVGEVFAFAVERV